MDGEPRGHISRFGDTSRGAKGPEKVDFRPPGNKCAEYTNNHKKDGAEALVSHGRGAQGPH